MSIEAMKLALDCLEDIFGKDKIDVGAINALRQAIAEAERQESDDLTIAYMSGFHDGKNTPQPKPEQEPVANGIIRTLVSIDKDGIETWKHEPFYTAPPKREWVGLDDEDMKELRETNLHLLYGAMWAARKLREKNGG